MVTIKILSPSMEFKTLQKFANNIILLAEEPLKLFYVYMTVIKRVHTKILLTNGRAPSQLIPIACLRTGGHQ